MFLKEYYETHSTEEERFDNKTNIFEVDPDSDSDSNINNFDFSNILNKFMDTLLDKKINKKSIINIIDKLTNNCNKISIKLFENMDKETSLELFSYLKQYNDFYSILSLTSKFEWAQNTIQPTF